MAKILVLESSARLEGSVSRQLVAQFVDALKGQSNEHEFVIRDLAHDPIPVLNSDTVGLLRTPPAQLTDADRETLVVSETLIAELKAADFVVIGSAMYNWNISASLKAWIDQVMRSGVTFTHGESGLVGLLAGKKGLVVMARGGSYADPAKAAVDMQRPYLQTVLGLMGLDMTYVTVDGTLLGEETSQKNIAVASEEVLALAATLA